MASAVGHVALVVLFVVAANVYRSHQPRTYVVNLVPAIAAVGVPHGSPKAPPAPHVPELPRREAAPARETAPAPPPEMPERSRADTLRLPDRSLPPRTALPRPGEKELPPVAGERPRTPAPPAVASTAPRREGAAPPPQPLGQPSGSPQGAGALTLNVSDFPFAWYLRTVQRKISENWTPPGQSSEGQQVVAVFEIGRDGQVKRPSIEKTSGNTLYDQAALRAIIASNPFPPLPAEYKDPMLRVHLGFSFVGDRG